VEEIQSLTSHPNDALMYGLHLLDQYLGAQSLEADDYISSAEFGLMFQNLEPNRVFVDMILYHLQYVVTFQSKNNDVYNRKYDEVQPILDQYADKHLFREGTHKKFCEPFLSNCTVTNANPDITDRWINAALYVLQQLTHDLIISGKNDSADLEKVVCHTEPLPDRDSYQCTSSEAMKSESNDSLDDEGSFDQYEYNDILSIRFRNFETYAMINAIDLIGFLTKVIANKDSRDYKQFQAVVSRLARLCSRIKGMHSLLNFALLHDFWMAMKSQRSAILHGQNVLPFDEPTVTKILIENGIDTTCGDIYGDTVLHKCVLVVKNLKSSLELMNAHEFPQECDQNRLDETGNSVIRKFCQALLNYGVHVDVRNAKLNTASKQLANLLPDLFHPFEYETLQCLSARVLRSVNYPSNLIPQHLVHFVSLH